MAIPKKKWLTKTELKKLHGYSPQKDRSKWLVKCLSLWSKLIRRKDGHRCQWCGSTKDPQAHHIVPRSAASTLGSLDQRNGMTLCFRCHIYRLKADPDGYIEMRNEWLREKGLTYQGLKEVCTARGKVSLPDLKVLYYDLERQVSCGQ